MIYTALAYPYCVLALARTDLAAIFKYASVGVRISAGMVAHIGTRFGGFGQSFREPKTLYAVSNDGCILDYRIVSIERRQAERDVCITYMRRHIW